MDDDEPRAIKTIPVSSQKTYKNQTDPRFVIDQELYRSNSANDLLDLKEGKKTKSQKIKTKKNLPRTISAKSYFDHYDVNNCEHCHGIDNMLKKDKSKLSSFIKKNPYFLRLFGNPRYDKSSPFLFVEDHKNKIDDDKIGLLPIPSKPKIILKSKEEKTTLYEMQRKVVMMRRFQYGKKFNEGGKISDVDDGGFFGKIKKIQLWWKYIYKIIYIQKVFRGFRIRRRVNFILYFIDAINKWQRILDNIKMRKILRDLVYKRVKKSPNKNNLKGYDFISKIRRKGNTYLNNSNSLYNKNNNKNKDKSNNLNNKENKERPNKFNNYKNEDEKNDDSFGRNKLDNSDNNFKNKNDLNKLSNEKGPKDKIVNNLSLLTKEYFDKKDAIDKIDKIGNNIKDYLRFKNNIKKKNINDENNKLQENGLFIDKVYIPKSIQRDNFNKSEKKENISNLKNNKNKDKNIQENPNKNENNKNTSKEPNNNNKKEGPYNKIKNKSNGINKNEDNNKNKLNNDKIYHIKNKSDNKYKPNDKEEVINNEKEPKINNKENIEGRKNIINSNDFIFKGKNCYIEKIRKIKRPKNLFENNKIKNQIEEDNNLSNNYGTNDSKYKNLKNDNSIRKKENDDSNESPLENKNKSDESIKNENIFKNGNKSDEINKNKNPKDNKNNEIKNNTDKYNTNKSINNQNDLINMLLDISKPENFQIINSTKKRKLLELSSSNKNNFSLNHNNRISPINRNLDNEEEKNNQQKNSYNDINKTFIIPFKKYIIGNKNYFITKEIKKNEIKKIKNDINSSNKINKLNNVEINNIESIYLKGNKKQKVGLGKTNDDKKKNSYEISNKKEQINYIGENKKEDKVNNLGKPEFNKNDNLVMIPKSITSIKYEGLNNENKNDNATTILPSFKNLKMETNKNINYLVEGNNTKEKNKIQNLDNNLMLESKPNITYIGNKKENNIDAKKSKSKSDFYNLDTEETFKFNYKGDNLDNINKKYSKYIPTSNSFNYPVKNKEKNENINNLIKDDLAIENNINIDYLGNKKIIKDKDNHENKTKTNDLSMESKDIINYSGLTKDYNLLLMPIENINISFINKEIKNNESDKTKNLIMEKNIDYNNEGKDNRPNLKSKNKKEDLIIESNNGFDIINNNNIQNINNKYNNNDSNLFIESAPIINIFSKIIKPKDIKDNINDFNNNKNLIIYEVDNFVVEGKEEEKNDTNKKDDYTIDSTIELNYERKNNDGKENTKDDLIDNLENKNYHNIKKYKSNKLLNDSFFMEKPPQIYKNLCYISKEIKKPKDKTYDNDNKNIISNYKKNKTSYQNISRPENENNNNMNYKKPINGLLISKISLNNNINKIKLIQDYIKKYLLNKDKDNEKIYKKPLFNQFYYYLEENPSEKKLLKNKNKKPDEEEEQNEKNEEKNKSLESSKNINNKNNEGEDKDNDNDEENNNKSKNNCNNKFDDYDGSTGPKYIERIIPNKRESRLYRLKPNHLLKIVKIQKGRSILEKLIQSGKVVPNRPRREEGNDIQNEYRSKTPENIKPNKKYNEDAENTGNDAKDSKDTSNLKNGNKIDDLVKNYLSKSYHEDDIDNKEEENNKKNEGNYTDYEDEILRNKRIKILKNNMGNYFYMSKIRKGDIDDSKVKRIQNEFRKFNRKDLDKDNPIIDDKNKDKAIDIKVRPNIIKNICYYEKIVVNNDTYKQFFDSENNKADKNNIISNKIYKIPNNWKNKIDDLNNINKNSNNINFITKLRHIKFKEPAKENEKNDSSNNINIEENEKSQEEKKDNEKYKKKEIDNIYETPIKSSCFISKENKINHKNKNKDNFSRTPTKSLNFISKEKKINEKNKNKDKLLSKENNKNIINNICFMSKERKMKVLSLPNKNYKNNHYLITKEIKMKNNKSNNEILSRKNYNFKNKNNNNCFITKERKLNIKSGIILPLKPIKFITKERKKILDINTNSILLPQKEIHFIDKIRKRENINQIKTIQNIFKLKNNKNKEKDNKNKLLYNNEGQTAFMPRTKYNFKDIDIDDSDFNEENLEKDNYYFNGYIEKIYIRNIYKYPVSNICYISKQNSIKKKEENKKNCSFLSLLDFFIKKNVQEYIYPKLRDKTNDNQNKILNTNYNFDSNNNPIDENLNEGDNKFTFPKYYNKLKRIYDFYKIKKRGESPRGKKIYDEILPDLKNCKSLNDLITKLNDDPEKSNNLINKKDDKINKYDYINEIGEFAKFDKNLSNGAFIKNKLKENEELNKDNNLFNTIKTIDDEYNNLVNGKYCQKCGKEKTICRCDDIDDLFKETEESKNNSKLSIYNKKEEDEDNLDFNIGDDDSLRNKKVNYFEYDSNKSRGLLVTNKPKLSDYISKPKNHLIIYNKKQLDEINQRIMGKDKNIDKFINASNNYSFNEGNSYLSNSSLSGARYNNRYNNLNNNNSINFNNDTSSFKKSNKKY